jgi:thioredoxin reductase (NADPH)
MTAPRAADAPVETDAVIVGAGPVGLFQVFELGLLEIRAHVIDSLSGPGGQCTALYADKPIYDIPGTPACTAQELIDRLLLQIAPFDAQFHFRHQVDVVRREDDGRFRVETSRGLRLITKTIFIASGVGSFQPRHLKIEGLAGFHDTQVFYNNMADPAALAGGRVLVIGDADAALECAMVLAAADAPRATNVTLMHRRDEFKAAPATVERFRAMRAAKQLQFIAGQAIGFGQHAGRLTSLTVSIPDGTDRTLPLDALVVMTGLSPKLGPIAEWGLALERKQLVVDTEKFQTSTPGIFAVGDVNTYAGKKKLILCGFHEAALAAYGAAAHVFPGRALPLEYTTTSPRLKRALGRTSTQDLADASP